MAEDPRFSAGLLVDIRELLRKHGFVPSPDPAFSYARVLSDLLVLVRHFEGKE